MTQIIAIYPSFQFINVNLTSVKRCILVENENQVDVKLCLAFGHLTSTIHTMDNNYKVKKNL